MKRTQLQLDEATHAELRRRAYEGGCSIASVIRDLIEQGLKGPPGGDRQPQWDRFMAAAGALRDDPEVAAEHDAYLEEAYADWNRDD